MKLPLLDGGQDASSEDHITHLTSAQVALGDVVVRQPKFCLLPLLIRSNPEPFHQHITHDAAARAGGASTPGRACMTIIADVQDLRCERC